MITLHKEPEYCGENAYTFRLDNHIGAIFKAVSKAEFYIALSEFKESFRASPYAQDNNNQGLSRNSLKFIEKQP